MSFPVISPAVLKELTERLKPQEPGDFCDIIVSSAAVEYAPRLGVSEVVKILMEEKDVLAYNMTNLPDEQSEEFTAQSQRILEMYPVTQYYWQMRMLFMCILQNREINFEKRFLLLNYAVKTVQGMIDGDQPHLVPKFIEDFTSPQMDYERVLEYFKEVRPNPAYSLTDGISLLKSLNKPNAAYKDVLSSIYKSLGVSGPETLKMADIKKYLTMRKAYSEFAAGEKAHYMENIMISYVWTFSLPLANPEFNFWEHFVFFCSLYNAIKVMITCYTSDGNDEAFVKAICAFDEAVRSSGGKLMRNIIFAARNSGQNNNGDMAILTLS
ncbi:MAG: hypothetical protein J1F11_00430 [Oscillospiraceae bacterium]|nr:hypothetical protein [Oscillospiraceae bacterium]